jgi:hypothetical protein
LANACFYVIKRHAGNACAYQKAMEKNMSYPIIKNAGPIPPLVLEVGDAFDVEAEGEPTESGSYNNWKSAAAYASVYGRKHGKKFTARRVSDSVYRFWRTA